MERDEYASATSLDLKSVAVSPLMSRGRVLGAIYLDEPDRMPPDIHIFTASKQPWVILPPGTPAVATYYDRKRYWPRESLERREALLAR